MDHVKDIPVQFWALIWTVIIVTIFSFFIWFKIKKQDPEKTPSKIIIIFEMYVTGFNNLMKGITGGKLEKAYPYLFTLFNFILWSSFISLLGFEPATSSIAFTFTIGFLTFLGIYIVGIGTMGFFHFLKHKYKNPTEIFTQFAPLISISVRLFGATVATAVIGDLVVIILANLTSATSHAADIYPIVSVFWSWAWTFIDSFFSLVEAFVFVVLTAIYWSQEYGPSLSWSERKKHYKAEKELKKQIKKENKKKIES